MLRGVLLRLRQPGFGKLMRAFWARSEARLHAPTASGAWARPSSWRASCRPMSGTSMSHYLHTPASVVRYAALLTGRTWTFSAHAKDIWTTPDWEKREKLAEALWGVTCTAQGAQHLQALGPAPDQVTLVYHGLDLSRFPAPPRNAPDARRLRSGRSRPHRLGRARGGEEGLRRPAAGARRPARRICTGASPMWAAAIFSSSLKAQAQKSGHRRSRGVPRREGAARHHRAAARGGSLRAALEEGRVRRPGRVAERADGSGEPEARHRGDAISPAFPNSSATASTACWCRRAIGKRCRTPSIFWRATRSAARRSAKRPSSGCAATSPWRAASTCSSSASARILDPAATVPDARVSSPRAVAFYAPLKSPDHPSPSGDRTMARLLLKALGRRVRAHPRQRICAPTTRRGDPDVSGAGAAAIAAPRPTRLDRALPRLAGSERPAPVVHLPCLLQGAGLDRPARRRALDIPYVVAEGSRAAKRADGPWALGHRGRRGGARPGRR